MTKEEFKTQLRQRLSGLPQGDIEERISFYEESINDRMEEGMPEEEAVAGIGTMDEIVEQIMSEIPLTRLVRDKVKPKRKFKAWEIVLLVLGSPVWLPLLITGIALMLPALSLTRGELVCGMEARSHTSELTAGAAT